uniref:BPTI/Kunitz inhibitor domain-containing protein n=1 Tax=Ixodes ricinus TaxID=34613 RepID=V5H0I3_IXORI
MATLAGMRRWLAVLVLALFRQPVEVCKEVPEHGPCRAQEVKYYYNSSVKSCQPFKYGGCRGNGNTFDSKGDCESNCGRPAGSICALVPDAGMCRKKREILL